MIRVTIMAYGQFEVNEWPLEKLAPWLRELLYDMLVRKGYGYVQLGEGGANWADYRYELVK